MYPLEGTDIGCTRCLIVTKEAEARSQSSAAYNVVSLKSVEKRRVTRKRSDQPTKKVMRGKPCKPMHFDASIQLLISQSLRKQY
jgi:hypothetical protein